MSPLSPDLREYCEGDEFQAECAEDEIILIQAAFYGRMRLGTCIQTAGELGCQEDILPYLDKLCSGRHRCRVRVSSMIDILPAHLQPCSMDYRSYLEAAYRCQSGKSGEWNHSLQDLVGRGMFNTENILCVTELIDLKNENASLQIWSGSVLVVIWCFCYFSCACAT